jgi:hypothetical protein
VGCSAAKTEEAAARASLKEAAMLALNDPHFSFDSPSFANLNDQINGVLKIRPSRDFDLRHLAKRSDFYTTHVVYSAKLSGIRNGIPYVSEESFEAIFGRIKRREPATIPYFTQCPDASSHV